MVARTLKCEIRNSMRSIKAKSIGATINNTKKLVVHILNCYFGKLNEQRIKLWKLLFKSNIFNLKIFFPFYFFIFYLEVGEKFSHSLKKDEKHFLKSSKNFFLFYLILFIF